MNSRYTCENCSTKRKVKFCRDCAQLICKDCTVTNSRPKYFCGECNDVRESEICGTCGTTCTVTNYIEETACSLCSNTDLGDPETLLNNLSSDFYNIINQVKDVHEDLADLYRSFDYIVALVRFCRLAGFLGFPQLEEQLKKCSKGLELINEKSINQLSKIRGEALNDLWKMDFFRDVEIDHFRSADAILRLTEEKISRHNAIIHNWIDEVQEEVDAMQSLAGPLRQHYHLLDKVKRYLPEGIHNVAAVIPPIGMSVSLSDQKFKGKAYIVFCDEVSVFLPKDALSKNTGGDVLNGIRANYDDITHYTTSHSFFRGSQLQVDMKQGEIAISAPVPVLERVTKYFDMVTEKSNFMLGSPKDIIEIESNAPDKNEYKRATNRFVDIFRDRLFGEDFQKKDNDDRGMPSMKELISRLRKLENSYKQIDNRARNHQINPNEYQSSRSEIKSSLESIRKSLNKLGGHLSRNMDNPIGHGL